MESSCIVVTVAVNDFVDVDDDDDDYVSVCVCAFLRHRQHLANVCELGLGSNNRKVNINLRDERVQRSAQEDPGSRVACANEPESVPSTASQNNTFTAQHT